ncbi:MAG TPA: MlaE family lipid ABC transporter permease subunit [Pseudolabrys sp.]|nr:MlaE family lipid ABC transporter permease subunit [Pseudolabrys sp.]
MSEQSLLEGRADGDRLTLVGSGVWTAVEAAELERLIEAQTAASERPRTVVIDMARIEKFDTYGAWMLERLIRLFKERGTAAQVVALPANYQALVDEVHTVNFKNWPAPEEENKVLTTFESIGHTVYTVIHSLRAALDMIGAVMVALLRVLAHPRNFRLTSMVHHLDNVAWRAVPIILLITFLIGCIIAQQGIFHFRKFGADIYVVDMVGILVMREIGVLIVAIMVAGRSGSAFTAELGSMKMREEVDALRTMGFDPVEVLVLPRVLALIIGLPLLTFIGSLAALYGGGLVCWLYGGIDPDVFLQRLREAITIDHFKVGIIKAPFMAMVIGVVACVQGFEVKGSAESLGMQTTASVVESIFLVIVLDGIFAIFFASIGM